MKNKMTIDWKKLWDDFHEWFEKIEEPVLCKTCNHREYNTPDWDEQEAKIKQLVDAQVRKIVKKKI